MIKLNVWKLGDNTYTEMGDIVLFRDAFTVSMRSPVDVTYHTVQASWHNIESYHT